jgi:tetratricopeptide (TPR) repeat protein
MPRRRRRRIPARIINWIIAAGLVLLTAVIYAQSAGFEFTNYDDTAYVPDNTHVRDGFSPRNVGWAFTTFETANWYPLTWLSLMLECQLFGPRPGVTHAVNALLHAANSVLLFAALRRMTGRRWPSAAVAALFAVHPLHVESVAWVAERKDVLSTLFFLVTLLAYVRYTARPGIARFSLVFLSLAAGLLCKPMLVTLPFVLLLLDYWPLGGKEGEKGRAGEGETTTKSDLPFSPSPLLPFSVSATEFVRRRPLWMLFVEKLPLLALSVGAAIVTVVAQGKMGATKMIGDKVALPLQLANAAIAYVKYLGMTFWPTDLAVFYPYDFHPPPPLVVEAMVVLSSLTLLCLYLLRRAPYLAVGWFWYLGTLVPTIGIVQVGAQGLADRYNYIPSIGIYVAVVWAMANLLRGADCQSAKSTLAAVWQTAPQLPFAAAATIVLIIAALAVVAHRQTAYWFNSELLFRHALAVTGDNPESCENLGDTLLHHDRFAEAETEFRKVLAMASAKEFSQTPSELARALAGQGRVDQAIELIHGAISDDLERAKALHELALFLAPRKYYKLAIELLQEAMKLAPQQAAAARNLSWVYATCPDLSYRNGPKAVELARRACELTDWKDANCRVALADAYLEVFRTTGENSDRESAIEELRAAHELNPKDATIASRLKSESEK